MPVIDVHMHVYPRAAGITRGRPMSSTSHGKAKIGNEEFQLLPPSFERSASTLETLVAHMDWCGIDKALLMPNPFYGYHNDYILEGVSRWPKRLKGVALVDLLQGAQAAEELAELYETTPLFGFKVETSSTFQCAPHKRMSDPEFAPVWDLLNQKRQPLFLHLFRRCDVEDLLRMAVEYPSILYVVCHMGADACFASGAESGCFREILELTKKSENIYLDTSTLPEYFDEEYPFPTARDYVQLAYRELGPERLMWASDYPGMLKLATLRQLIHYVSVGCADIPARHMDRIMGGNAQNLFFE